MCRAREHRIMKEVARWVLKENNCGDPYWSGGGVDDKQGSDIDGCKPFIADPSHFPLGTTIVCSEISVAELKRRTERGK